ncbi:MAG: LicD family protein [Ruminococcaceae bacterium]|nr:LicD family protein [Oscillospiraceae bacterium]
MKLISLEENKKLQLEILKNVAAFCDEHGLTYFLAYGTLLGAVRHKGFIPWDDDIDIQMPRDDYNKLIEIFNTQNKDNKYRLISPEENISKHPFTKVIDIRTIKNENGISYREGALGIDIDVFPLDGTPDDYKEYKKWYKKLNRVYWQYHFANIDIKSSKKLKIKIASAFMKPFVNRESALKKARDIHKQYPYKSCDYVAVVESIFNSINNRTEKSNYTDTVLLDFENCKFKAPVGYDVILSSMYGDYMKLPPKEKQATHHDNDTYWKEGYENEEI